MPSPESVAEYWISLMQAVADGKIEAKDIVDMTPEARDAFHARITSEEKSEIASGLAEHAGGKDEE